MYANLNVEVKPVGTEVGPKPVKTASQDEPARMSLMPDEVTVYGLIVRVLLWAAFGWSGLVMLGAAMAPGNDGSGISPTANLCAVIALVGLAVSHQKR